MAELLQLGSYLIGIAIFVGFVVFVVKKSKKGE